MAIDEETPKVVIIAGPNGAGKTTITPRVLRSVDVVLKPPWPLEPTPR